jgi:hypothetical protein
MVILALCLGNQHAYRNKVHSIVTEISWCQDVSTSPFFTPSARPSLRPFLIVEKKHGDLLQMPKSLSKSPGKPAF